jgi:hypothetical protein
MFYGIAAIVIPTCFTAFAGMVVYVEWARR